MFGMGSGYADLLRPEDALRQDREKMEQIELSESNATNNNNSEKVCRVKTFLRKSFHGGDEIESQEESNNLTDIRKEWKEVFQKLDNADGTSDGRIDRKALVKWVSALNLKKTIEFEANLNISPRYARIL